MCGRYSRARQGLCYVVPLIPDAVYPESDLFRPSWNVAPGTPQPVIRPDGPRLERWGYRPAWADPRGAPMMVNARLDRATTSTWRSAWTSSRVIVPADGWYEWVLEEGAKQPYYITPIDGEPLFFAGLSGVRHGAVPREDKGFVIVTDAAGEGMLDVHDRRPLVFSAEVAEAWLDPSTTFEEATHLANNASRPVEAFRWFAVSKGVNKTGNDDSAFNEPLGDRDSAPGASA
jgi:putative SOS response-associated peptidase YedK